jgi:hypothetical protein
MKRAPCEITIANLAWNPPDAIQASFTDGPASVQVFGNMSGSSLDFNLHTAPSFHYSAGDNSSLPPNKGSGVRSCGNSRHSGSTKAPGRHKAGGPSIQRRGMTRTGRVRRFGPAPPKWPTCGFWHTELQHRIGPCPTARSWSRSLPALAKTIATPMSSSGDSALIFPSPKCRFHTQPRQPR